MYTVQCTGCIPTGLLYTQREIFKKNSEILIQFSKGCQRFSAVVGKKFIIAVTYFFYLKKSITNFSLLTQKGFLV